MYAKPDEMEKTMEHKLVKKTAFKIVGLKYHGKNENNEIMQLWMQFGPRIGEVKKPPGRQ